MPSRRSPKACASVRSRRGSAARTFVPEWGRSPTLSVADLVDVTDPHEFSIEAWLTKDGVLRTGANHRVIAQSAFRNDPTLGAVGNLDLYKRAFRDKAMRFVYEPRQRVASVEFLAESGATEPQLELLRRLERELQEPIVWETLGSENLESRDSGAGIKFLEIALNEGSDSTRVTFSWKDMSEFIDTVCEALEHTGACEGFDPGDHEFSRSLGIDWNVETKRVDGRLEVDVFDGEGRRYQLGKAPSAADAACRVWDWYNAIVNGDLT